MRPLWVNWWGNSLGEGGLSGKGDYFVGLEVHGLFVLRAYGAMGVWMDGIR